MTWISFVCLLAITSGAFARSVSYGSYSALPQVQPSSLIRDFTSQQTQQPFTLPAAYGQQQQQSIVTPQQQDQTVQPEIQPVQSSYGQQYGAQSMIRRPSVQLDQSYSRIQTPAVQRSFPSQVQLMEEQKQKLQQLIQESVVLSEADKLCQGKQPETVIPLDNNRRFVVCIDESKGYEQQCPRGLVFHPESRRCERKLGPLENPCQSQPCLNNGQCVQTDFSSYKCQCAPGYDGEHCELDATVCQTQQPCGQSPDTKCQSFRAGAALQHICILQNGQAYGLTASQAQQSPCTGVDGTFPLAFSDKGFIMCNGDLMYVESCPGGTVWDDLNKACVWPDMQGLSFEDQTQKTSSYGSQSSYNTIPRTMTQQQFEQPKPILSYGQQQSQIKSFPQQKLFQDESMSSYGSKMMQMPVQQDQVQQPTYGGFQQQQIPKQHEQIQQSTYGGYQQQIPKQQEQVQQSTYGGFQQPIIPKQQEQVQQSTYGGFQQQQIPKQQFFQPSRQQDLTRLPQQHSGY